MSDIIQHLGTVESIEGSHVRVIIVQTSACATCAAHKFCNSSESKEKMIDVYTKDATSYRVGQSVKVFGTTSMGMRAVLWAFGVPFVVLVMVLYTCILLTDGNEPLSALVAMGALMVYYLILYMCRHRMSRKFVFTIASCK
ncbi:MAG: SoxR reducing system RseC family protein [Bacteroidaceae bacterium]|nr:SoxR reducing system RseC family protein [Bacteroidaceae bacterium]